VLVALGADVEILFEVLFPDNLAAAVTLHPQAFGADFLFAGSVKFAGLSLEPSHRKFVICDL
jgi:hypothetical protein